MDLWKWTQYINWIEKQTHLKNPQYIKLREYNEKRKFIKTEEIKNESKTIEKKYINPILLEAIENNETKNFVTERDKKQD